MAIELDELVKQAEKVITGSGFYTVTAGKSLKFETSPGGVVILNEEVPSGKTWDVHISVHIVETDV